MKIAVIGGGSSYTPELISGLLNIREEIALNNITLVDRPEGREKLAILADFSRRLIAASGAGIRVDSTEDLSVGMDGASVIINQFRAGGLEGRARDERIPLEFGLIGQETTGMGGMANALRTLPILDRIVDEARRCSDDAWIVNFTNPAGLNTEYLINHKGYEKTVGLCNVPIEFILEAAKLFNTERENVELNYYGLNHLSWVGGVRIAGQDCSNDMWERVRVKMKNNPDIDYGENFIPDLRLLLNPYLDYYYNTAKMLAEEIRDSNGPGTRAEQIMGLEQDLLKLYAQSERKDVPEELSKRGGYMYSTVAAELIRDISVNAGNTHIVNTLNRGAVREFPDDYVMEIPCRIDSDGPHPLPQEAVNPVCVGLIHTVKQFERLTIKAHITRDPRYAKQAMLIHPLGPDESGLNRLWDRLAEANAAWWAVR